MIVNATGYERAQAEIRSLEERLQRLQQAHSIVPLEQFPKVVGQDELRCWPLTSKPRSLPATRCDESLTDAWQFQPHSSGLLRVVRQSSYSTSP